MGVDAARRRDEALAVHRRGGRADQQIRIVHDVRIAGPPHADDQAVLHPDVRLEDAEHGIDDDDVADQEVELARRGQAVVHHQAGAQRLAPAAQHLVAVARVVALDQREQVRVAEADAVARGGPVARRILLPADLTGHRGVIRRRCAVAGAPHALEPLGQPLAARRAVGQAVEADDDAAARRRRRGGRACVSPGRQRTESPAGMSRCMPQAWARSKTSRRFTSKNGKWELTKIVWSESVLDLDLGGAPPRVDGQSAHRRSRISPGSIRPPSIRLARRSRGSGPDRLLDVQHAHAVAEEAFDLDGADQLGHAVEHLGGGERAPGRLA